MHYAYSLSPIIAKLSNVKVVVQGMIKEAFTSALYAEGYIVGIVLVINFGMKQIEHETLLIPIAMLSLFVLSAAIMGYLFLLRPLRQYLDGQKDQAVSLFLTTVSFFAIITVALLLILFY